MLLEDDGINFGLKVIFNLSYKHSPILSLSLRSFYTDRKIIYIFRSFNFKVSHIYRECNNYVKH